LEHDSRAAVATGHAQDIAGDLNNRGHVLVLTENASYRSNIAFTNISTVPVTFTVRLYDGSGTELSSFDLTLAAGEYVQETRVFRKRTGRTDIEGGYARIEVTAGSGLGSTARWSTT
jgi:hypothetical protein